MTIIKSELDLRHWCTNTHPSPKSIRWVEPAISSTFGLPDLWVPYLTFPSVQIELKLAPNHPRSNNSVSRITIRPNQRKQLKLIHHSMSPVGIIVAIKHTPIIYALRITKSTTSLPLIWGDLIEQSLAKKIQKISEALDFFAEEFAAPIKNTLQT